MNSCVSSYLSDVALIEARYKVVGMTCQSCAVSVETMLSRIQGVAQAKVNFAGQEVWVQHDPEVVPLTALQAVLAPAGYALLADAKEAGEARRRFLRRLQWSIVLSGVVAVGGMVLHFWPSGYLVPVWLRWGYFVISLGLVLSAGRLFWRAAWQQFRYRQLSMDTLIALSLWGSILLSGVTLWVGAEVHTEAAAEILFFVLIGRYLEEKARAEAALARDALSALATPLARKSAIEEIWVATETVAVDDLIEVRSGEIVPVDGVIQEGEGHLQEALLTGEPLPQWRTIGEPVLAGTTLLEGCLVIRATKAAGQSFLAQLMARLERAQATRAKAQRLADRVSAVFVPVVLSLALFAMIWAIGQGQGWGVGSLRLLSVLVISCPCALGLATPLAVQLAMGRSSQRQILLREVAQLEDLPRCNLWAFDKTGTLTQAQITLKAETWWDPTWHNLLAPLLAQSEHPLARAVGKHLLNRRASNAIPLAQDGRPVPSHVPHSPMQSIQSSPTLSADSHPSPFQVFHQASFPGKGVLYQTNLGPLYVGHPRWLRQKAPSFPEVDGAGIGVLGPAGPIALFQLEDPPRAALRPFLEYLRAKGIRTVLLSGDPSEAPQKIGMALGFTEIWGGLSPIEKAAWVEEAKRQGATVAFVGDGLNDTLALQAANVGIAVYHSAGAAVQSAGIALLAPTEKALPQLYHLSQRLRRIIIQNLVWAFGYNLVALPMAMGLVPGVYVSPALSALFMSLSSVAVVLNSLRLRL